MRARAAYMRLQCYRRCRRRDFLRRCFCKGVTTLLRRTQLPQGDVLLAGLTRVLGMDGIGCGCWKASEGCCISLCQHNPQRRNTAWGARMLLPGLAETKNCFASRVHTDRCVSRCRCTDKPPGVELKMQQVLLLLVHVQAFLWLRLSTLLPQSNAPQCTRARNGQRVCDAFCPALIVPPSDARMCIAPAHEQSRRTLQGFHALCAKLCREDAVASVHIHMSFPKFVFLRTPPGSSVRCESSGTNFFASSRLQHSR